MKRTAKAWVFFVFQLAFMLVAPCVMVWLQYGELTEKYKISVTAILLSILVSWVFKRIVLNKWLKTLEIKLANIETNALMITDMVAIESNKRAWRNYSLASLFFSSITPLLLFALAVITIKTVEQGLIKLYGCLMFCLISIAIGVIFKILEIFAMRLTHEH